MKIIGVVSNSQYESIKSPASVGRDAALRRACDATSDCPFRTAQLAAHQNASSEHPKLGRCRTPGFTCVAPTVLVSAMPLTAIVREVSSIINDCELSFHARQW